MTTPDWWQFLMLATAAWRVWHLLAYDTVLDGPRNMICGLPWDWTDDKTVPRSYREKLAEFITCPYCLGFWIAVVWWGAFQWSEHWSVVVAVPWALSAGLILTHRLTDSD